MESDKPDQREKKAQLKFKVIRDFAFLLERKPIPFNSYCTKYILDEGEGDGPISQQPENFDIAYSCKKYDYEGRLLNTISIAKVNRYDKNESDLKIFTLSMKLKERAWFNVCNTQVYSEFSKTEKQEKSQILGQEQIQDCDQIDQEPTITSEIQTKTTQNQTLNRQKQQNAHQEDKNVEIKEDKLQKMNQIQAQIEIKERTGFHYQIILERVQYKNSDDAGTKKKVFAQKKEESKKLFIERKFQEAAKIYGFLDSITANLPRYKKNPVTGQVTDEPFYTSQQKFEFQDMNINSKINFLKCIFKMIEFNVFLTEEMETMAQRNVTYLLDKRPNDSVVKFLESKWLLKERLLDSALDAAKRSYAIEKTAATWQLIQLIHEQKANKGKIKVKVQQ